MTTIGSPTPKNRTRAIIFLVIGILLIAASVTAYILLFPPVCGAAGCTNGMLVVLSGNIPQTFIITLTTPDGDSRQVQCLGSQANGSQDIFCLTDQVIFNNFTPEQVTVTIDLEDGRQVIEQFEPEYVTVTPNGPKCPPECQFAEVQIALP